MTSCQAKIYSDSELATMQAEMQSWRPFVDLRHTAIAVGRFYTTIHNWIVGNNKPLDHDVFGKVYVMMKEAFKERWYLVGKEAGFLSVI